MTLNMLIGILEQGLIYGIMAMGLLITYRILDFPDLTVDSSFPLGAAVSATLTLQGVAPWLTLLIGCAAGGIAGWNGGSIKNCSTYATLGTQQDGYAYLGGIVGINNGTVTDSAPAASITVRGRYIIGGVAGLNLTNASITYNTSDNAIPVTVQANECAGGVAGVNCGNIALGSTTLRVNITAESYAGGIAGSNNMRNATTASIAGGKVTGTVTATKNYAGGAAGANYAEIADVTLIGGARVRANDQFAGGIAGSNRAGTNGQIGTITGCTNTAGQTGNNYTVYATNGNAGGIAGSNESGAQIVDSVVGGVKIGVAKCDAAGIAANNFGIIQGGTVGSCDITFAGESIGAVTAINNAGAEISDVMLKENCGSSSGCCIPRSWSALGVLPPSG